MPIEDMNVERCREIIYSENYADFFVQYAGNVNSIRTRYRPECIRTVDNNLAIFHIINRPSYINLNNFPYNSFPKCYGLMDTSNMESAGVLPLRRQPYINLTGRNILIGIIDTGIDYTHPVFLNPDGTTRIVKIWDQTIISDSPPENFIYGTEYTEEQINEALRNEDPLSVVPSVDENGHGTFMAGIAAGNDMPNSDFTGTAPLANIAVVKLKQAKKYLKDYYLINDDVECFQDTDIIMAVKYLYILSFIRREAIIIYIGVGSNQGDHAGHNALSEYINTLADSVGYGLVLPGGNEVNRGHHYEGSVIGTEDYEDVEINVENAGKGFSLEIWTSAPNLFSVGLISPGGEYISKIPAAFDSNRDISFLFEGTLVSVNYQIIEAGSGDPLIFMRFETPSNGIWRIRIFRENESIGKYHIWLPINGFIAPEIVFLRPDPNTTICTPADASNVITTAAYDHVTNSIYINSSRGYTRTGIVKPDITAPGVNIYGPLPGGVFGRYTGTSVAAAHIAGIAALLFEWAFVLENDYNMDTIEMKTFLIKGADRTSIEYPNREWGYGIVDIYNTFASLTNRL